MAGRSCCCDDENSDEGIKKADTSLFNEKVVAIIGHSVSANTIKAYPLVTGREKSLTRLT